MLYARRQSDPALAQAVLASMGPTPCRESEEPPEKPVRQRSRAKRTSESAEETSSEDSAPSDSDVLTGNLTKKKRDMLVKDPPKG